MWTFWEQSPQELQSWEGPGLRGPDRKALYFLSHWKNREGEPHCLESGGRDGVKHTRKVEISGGVARNDLLDT